MLSCLCTVLYVVFLWLQYGFRAQDKFPTLWDNKVDLNLDSEQIQYIIQIYK